MSVKGFMEAESLRNAAEWYMVLSRGNTQFPKHFTKNRLEEKNNTSGEVVLKTLVNRGLRCEFHCPGGYKSISHVGVGVGVERLKTSASSSF